MSTSESSTRALCDPYARPTPDVAANACADTEEREPMATTCCVVDACSAATKRSAIHPVPSTPQRRLGTESGDGRRGAGSASGSEGADTAYLLGIVVQASGHSTGGGSSAHLPAS